MAERYTDKKNNTYPIIQRKRSFSEKTEERTEREQKIVEELCRILLRK